MLYKIMKLLLFLLLISPIALSAQSKSDITQATNRHLAQITVGRLAYANSFNLPNGLAGNILSIRYGRNRVPPLSSWKSHIATSLSSSALRTNIAPNLEATIYRYNNLDIEFGWHWKTPNFLPNMEVNLGIGPSFIAELIYPTQKADDIANNFTPDGMWGLNGKGYIQILYSVKKYVISESFGFPIVGIGHNPKPPFINLKLSQNPYPYFLRPNTAYHLLNYRMLSSEFRVAFPYQNIHINISYIFKYFHHSLAPFYQTYAQHKFGLGISF